MAYEGRGQPTGLAVRLAAHAVGQGKWGGMVGIEYLIEHLKKINFTLTITESRSAIFWRINITLEANEILARSAG